MPSLDRGNTEQAGGKGKTGNRFLKPNFERVPSRFAVGSDKSDGSVVWPVQDTMREICV
jgi:hypothetical protein